MESLVHVTQQLPCNVSFTVILLALHQQQLWLAAQISCRKVMLQRLKVFLMQIYSVEELNDTKRKMCSSECNNVACSKWEREGEEIWLTTRVSTTSWIYPFLLCIILFAKFISNFVNSYHLYNCQGPGGWPSDRNAEWLMTISLASWKDTPLMTWVKRRLAS